MYRRRPLSHGVALAVSRLWDVALAIVYFAMLMVRPDLRSHYGQQFLYKTEGGTFERSFAALGASAGGRRLLVQKPDSVAMLRDRERLRALSPGSLGRSYQDFMMAGEIDEGLYLDGAIEAGQRFERDPARAWFRTRVEAGHDMRHVLTGYGIDPLGETCLMAFRFGQTGHVGTFVIAAFGFVVLGFRRQSLLLPAMLEAYRHGRSARLIDMLLWEEALERPLVELRREFGIRSPCCYLSNGRAVAPIKAQIDICETFGPLAAMHAALDRQGIGMPCGVVACFPDKNEREVESAIAIARNRFPVLQTRLEWQKGRPVLVPELSANRDRGSKSLLDFSASESGKIWKYRLVQEGRNTWLQATWMHGVADGLSMLRFIQAIAAVSGDAPPVLEARTPRPICDQQRFLYWLPAFLLDQRRSYVVLAQPATSIPQVSWLSAPVVDREQVMKLARTSSEGLVGWLAAAVSLAFADQQGKPGGDIMLNVQIARDGLAGTNGFGFGSGSLRLAVHLGESPSMEMLARAIGRRVQQLANRGWDRNLERLLGSNPARHTRFARIEAGRSTNPNITISWKGHYADLGADGGSRNLACFAAAPTLHVSAHSDASGLSLSVTSRQKVAERSELLLRIARHLGCQTQLLVHELDSIGAAKGENHRSGSDHGASSSPIRHADRRLVHRAGLDRA
jgi:ubiquinone biosynthesis protein COQ4